MPTNSLAYMAFNIDKIRPYKCDHEPMGVAPIKITKIQIPCQQDEYVSL